jgi:hypothetical protein
MPPATPRRRDFVSIAVEQEKSSRFHSGHGLGQNGLSVIVHWCGGAGSPGRIVGTQS